MLDSVLAYINNHLEETITLDELAKVTGYSPFYLHRKLKAELQEPIGSFIQKQRMQAATYLLAFTELPVSQVRLLVGYTDDSAFSRVFKNITGVSPRTFRQQRPAIAANGLTAGQYLSLKCEIVRLPERKAVVFPSLGNYFNPDIYQVWDKAAAFIAEAKLAPESLSYYGVLHDCQHLNLDSLCRYDAALVSNQSTGLPAPKHFISTLPGGKFARYKFCCSVADYPQVSAVISEHLFGKMQLKHRESISYFEFESLPTIATANSLFITWYIPVY